MEKCTNCPVKCGLCISQKANHDAFCKKIDPKDKSYNVKYIDAVNHLSCGEPYKEAVYVEVETKEEPPLEYPSMFQMAKNYTKSTIRFAKSGFKVSDDEMINRRLAICSDCKLFDHLQRRCMDCGCPVDEKARRAVEPCPVGRWEMSDEQLLADANSKTRKDEGLHRLNNSIITHQAEAGGTCCGA